MTKERGAHHLVLLAEGMVDEETLLKAASRERRVPLAEPRWTDKVETRVVHLVSAAHAHRWRIVPLRLTEGNLVVATSQVENLDRLAEMSEELGFPLKPVLARRVDVERALAQHYPASVVADNAATVASDVVVDVTESTGIEELRRQLLAESNRSQLSGAASGRKGGPTQARPPSSPRTSPSPPANAVASPNRARPVRAAEPPRSPRPPPSPPKPPDETEMDGLTRVEPVKLDLSEEPEPDPKEQFGDIFPLATEVDARPVPRNPAPSRLANNFNVTQPLDPKDVEQARMLVRYDDDNNATQRLDPREVQQARMLVRSTSEQSRTSADPARPSKDRPPTPTPTAVAVAPAAVAEKMLRPATGDLLAGFQLPPVHPPAGPTPFDEPSSRQNREHAIVRQPPPSSTPVIEGERFGKYILIKRIKAGGMAEVFLGKTVGVEGFEKQVAIKRILPHLTESSEFVEMFIDEAKLTVQLNHANIANIYEFGKEAGAYYLVMEYVHGRDVNALFRDAYRRKQPLSVGICCYIVQQLCEGLDYAHRKRSAEGRELCIVHRDISPANILVSYEGAVKIIDFGIAKAVSKLSMTRPGLIKGKISYMSPEQMRGQPIDRRSDVFAAGIILHELLTGRRLFATKNDVDTIRNVIKNPIPALEQVRVDVPKELSQIVMKALDRDVEKRYAWASELSVDLQAFMVRNSMQNVRTELVNHLSAHLKGDD